jgi:DNA-binding LacI/PurR family transcriptional regulator
MDREEVFLKAALDVRRPVMSKLRFVETCLRKRILSGTWGGDARLPGDEDLAIELGVSQSTVGNALSNLASEGLVERRQRRGTFIVPEAAMGVIVAMGRMESLSSPLGYYYREIMDQTIKQVGAAGFRVKLGIGSGATPDEFADSIHLFDSATARNVMGVISTMPMGPLEARLENMGIPAVTVVTHRPVGRYSVVLDYRSLCHQGIHALEQAGIDDYIVVLLAPRNVSERERDASDVLQWIRERDSGFAAERLYPVCWSRDRDAARDWLARTWRTPAWPRAFFFLDDVVCENALDAMRELGIRVPEDVAVVTEGSVGRRWTTPIELASIEFDGERIVDAAWNRLRRLIDRRPVDECAVFVQPRFTPGASLPLHDNGIQTPVEHEGG